MNKRKYLLQQVDKYGKVCITDDGSYKYYPSKWAISTLCRNPLFNCG